MQPHRPVMPPGASPNCRFCGAQIDPLVAASAGLVCNSPACRSKHNADLARQAEERDWNAFMDVVRHQVARHAEPIIETLRGAGRSARVGMVPQNNRPLKTLPPERLAAFRQHLEEIITEAFQSDEDLPTDTTIRDQLDAPEQPLIDAACSSCKGHCCQVGGSRHAFTTAHQIKHLRVRNPGITPDEMRQMYLSRLPERSTEDSCVFHSEKGCTLDRDQRAEICNRHICHQIQYIQRAVPSDVPMVLLSADEDGRATVKLHNAPEETAPEENTPEENTPEENTPEETAAGENAAGKNLATGADAKIEPSALAAAVCSDLIGSKPGGGAPPLCTACGERIPLLTVASGAACQNCG